MQCNAGKKCIKCRSGYDLLGTIGSTEILCEQLTILQTGHYKNPSNNVYYRCIDNCRVCSNGNTCTTCISTFKPNSNQNQCIPAVENCQTYNDDGLTCQTCNTDYSLVIISSTESSCMLTSSIDNHYYPDSDHYVKCSFTIPNCDTCRSGSNCISCLGNNAIVDDDHTGCKDLSSKKYYYDSEQEKYLSCSNTLSYCEKCEKNNNVLKCILCQSTYSLIHGATTQCESTSSYESNNEWFTNDSGLNYYPCNNAQYHNVRNCVTCSSKESCQSCQTNYELVNSNTLCLSQGDLSNLIYFKNPRNNQYYLCSDVITGCNKCSDSENCIKCKDDYALGEDNKCISESSISGNKFYLDSTTGKYISCSKIENCDECSSGDACTKCLDGYKLKNSSCEKKNSSKKLTISLSVVGSFIVLALIAFFLLKKFVLKTKDNIVDNKTSKIGNYDNMNEELPKNEEEPNAINIHNSKNEKENADEKFENNNKNTKRNLHNEIKNTAE